jgi:hypothetical protein
MGCLENRKIENKTKFLNTHHFEDDFSQIVQEARGISKDFQGIGIGILGELDEKKTATFNTNNLIEWEGKPILESFQKEFNCPVIMENDAVVAALGEIFFGGLKEKEFVYITWGTGIGGAWIRKVGDHMEVSQLPWANYLKSWEVRCGGANIKRKYGKPPEKLMEEEWKVVMKDFFEELIKFTKKLRTKIIVSGGGITNKQASRLESLKTKQPKIKISRLGEDTGLYGAFGLLKILFGKEGREYCLSSFSR